MNQFFFGLIWRRAAAAAMLAACLAILAGPTPARGDTLWWNTTSGNWSTLASWSTAFSGGSAPVAPQTVPGVNDTAIFNTSGVTAATTAILGANTSLGGISVLDTAGAVTIEGVTTDRTLTLGAGGITSQSTAIAFTLGSNTAGKRVNVDLAASQAWTALGMIGTSNFNMRGGVQRVAGATNMTLLIDQSPKTNFNGTVADGSGGGTLSLWKRGSGEMVMGVANTYSGTTTVQSGILTVSNATGLGTSALQLAGGTLNVAAGISMTAPSSVTVTGGVTSLSTGSNTSVVNLGTISRSVGAGLLARATSSTGTFNASNSLTNGIIGPWAFRPTGVNAPGWMTISAGTITAAALTSATNANNLTSATANYSSSAGATLTADRSAYVWSNTGTVTTELANFNLTLSGFANGAGTNTISGTGTGRLVIGGDELVIIPYNGSIVISAGIASGTGHLTIAPMGNGNVTLSGSNAHSGGTSLHKNTLNINNANALGTGTFTIAAGSIDNSSAADLTLATNNVQVWNSDFTFVGTRNLGMGTGSISLGSSAGATRTVTVTANKLTIGGGIANGSHANLPTTGLTKAGVGILELSGSNSYTGPTTVSAGSLLVNGLLQTSAVTVRSGGLLGGAGTLGSVSILSGGTFAPGNSPGLLTAGTLSLAGTTVMEIDAAGTRGTAYDATNVTSQLTYGGALNLVFAAGISSPLPDNTTFNLFDFGSYTSTFSTITTSGGYYGGQTLVDSGDGDTYTAAVGSQTLEFTHSTGNLVIVPEPAAVALAGIASAAAALALLRRRR
jgi:autotransporter-associated beta strand protein